MSDIDKFNIPSSFTFPNARDFAEHTAGALSDIGFDSEMVRNHLVPPMQSQVNALITAFEGTGDLPIKSIAQELSGPSWASSRAVQLGQSISGMVFSLVEGDVQGVVASGVDLASTAIADLAASVGSQVLSSIADIVPVVGSMISAVIDVVKVFDSGWSEDLKNAARQRAGKNLEAALLEFCPKLVSSYDPSPTSPAGTTPADLFRTNFISAQMGHPVPPTLASMYILLCGAETQGVGFSKRSYDELVNKESSRRGKHIGIDPFIQRRMWGLIKSIFYSARDPRLSAEIVRFGDQGRSAYAVLQSIVRDQWIKKRWDKDFLLAMSRYLGRDFQQSVKYDCGPNCSGVAISSCGDYLFLEQGMERAQRIWQSVLEEEFCEWNPDGSCKWRPVPSPDSLKRLSDKRGFNILKGKPRLAIVVRPEKANELEYAVEQSVSKNGKDAERRKKVYLATGTAVAGMMIWGAARYMSKRRV